MHALCSAAASLSDTSFGLTLTADVVIFDHVRVIEGEPALLLAVLRQHDLLKTRTCGRPNTVSFTRRIELQASNIMNLLKISITDS